MKKLLCVLLVLTAGCAEPVNIPEEPVPQETEETSVLLQEVQGELTYGTVTLQIPEDWQYEMRTFGPEYEPALCVGPGDGTWMVFYTAEKNLGVCGTGLESKQETFGAYTGTSGYYDGNARRTFIFFDEPYGHFMFARMGDDTPIDMDDAEMQKTETAILNTIVLSPKEAQQKEEVMRNRMIFL